MHELEVESANSAMLAKLIESDTAEDKTAARRLALEKAVSLPVRAQAAKNLATALVALTTTPGKKLQKMFDAETAAKDQDDWQGDLDLDPDFPPRPN
jgi:hypothetical protein